jgi:antirestriction protein ArdC
MANGRISPPEIWTAERIIELIQAGNLPPWAKSWNSSPEMAPRNMLNPKIPYRGLNYMLLSMVADILGSPFFMTPKQVLSLGGKIKKGEKTWPVFFFNTTVRKSTDEDEEDRKTFFCKGYRVLNLTQTTDIPEAKIPVIPKGPTFEHTPIEECERLVAGYQDGPMTTHSGNRAVYFPDEDRIYIPLPTHFVTSESYYSTRFHEMAHSTGHSSRLNREGLMSSTFGSHAYSEEELVAEFCAAMLCGRAGIAQRVIENSASYIKGWSKKLKPEMLVLASRAGQKAYRHITGETSVEAEPKENAA